MSILIFTNYELKAQSNLKVAPLMNMKYIDVISQDVIEEKLNQIISKDDEESVLGKKKIFGVVIEDQKRLLDVLEAILPIAKKNSYIASHHKLKKKLLLLKQEVCQNTDTRASLNAINVECMGNYLFGKREFKRILFAQLLFNTSLSFYMYSDGRAFTEQELDDVIKTLNHIFSRKFPENFLKIQKNIYISAGEVDCNKISAERIAVGFIYDLNLKPKWSCKDSNSKGNIIIHEMGHMFSTSNYIPSIFGYKDEFAISKEWISLSEWEIRSRFAFKWLPGDKNCFLSMYSHQDPMEDFAETFLFYILDKEYVEGKCPLKAGIMNKLLNAI